MPPRTPSPPVSDGAPESSSTSTKPCELRQVGADRVERRCELAVVHDRARVGVVQEVPQLVLAVAVVHVDGDGPELERREHALEVLGAVVEVERDVVAGTDAEAGEVVGEPGGARVGLARR